MRVLAMVAAILLAAALWALPVPGNPRTILRPPTPPTDGTCVRTWLLCGDFPMAIAPGAPTNAAHRPGLTTDYLREHGGEAAIDPYAGLTHTRADGTKAVWTEITSDADVIDLARAFAPRLAEYAIGYAFTSFRRAQAGELVLTVGSDDGVRVWVNGALVIDRQADRGLRLDDDAVQVRLPAGENRILVKVDQGKGGWAFMLRLLDPTDAALLATAQTLMPSIADLKPSDPNYNRLVVLTDAGMSFMLNQVVQVEVEVVGPGGGVVAKTVVPRGAYAIFDPARWPDGVYDVRCRVPGNWYLTSRMLWYKGDPKLELERLLQAAARADGATETGMVTMLLADMVKDKLGTDLVRGTVKREQYWKVLPQLLEFAELEAGGEYALGFDRLAYRDPVDDSAQFARVYFPRGYTRDKHWPLVLVLHGMDSGNPPYAKGWGSDQRYDSWADRWGIIVVHPFGRGNSWYRNLGDQDVMRCVAMAKARYAVDPDRVYLTGYSMGGAGTWHVGTRHPETFAALAPMIGGLENRVLISDAEFQAQRPSERFYTERRSSFAQAESLLTTPIFVSHGEKDTTVPVEIPRYGVRLLQSWGYDIRYAEYPGRGHASVGSEPDVMDFFLAHTLVRDPAHIRVRAGELKAAAAHWARIVAREDPYHFVSADIQVVAKNLIKMATANVLEIELTPPAALVDLGQPVGVIWNGTDTRMVTPEGGKLVLRAEGYVPPALRKRPELEGPIRDAQTMPFAIVVGTTARDANARAMCAWAGKALAQRWEETQRVTPRVFTDTALTGEQRKAYALLLVGGPEESSVTKDIGALLPLRVAADGVTVDGQRFPCTDALAGMVYPSPFNPDRYLVCYAATSPVGYYFMDRVWPEVDFCVVDGRPGQAVAQGFFDNAWRFRMSNTELRDAAAWRATTAKGPTRATAAGNDPVLWLSDLMEVGAEGAFRTVRRDVAPGGASLVVANRTFAHGLAVTLERGGGTMTYDLAGATYTRAKAVLGIAVQMGPQVTDAMRRETRVYYRVLADGKEVFKSRLMLYEDAGKVVDLDVSVEGVRTLVLEVRNDASGANAAAYAALADLRLEK